MVQSRIKMLEKLPVLEPVVIEPGVTLKFPEVRLNDEIKNWLCLHFISPT